MAYFKHRNLIVEALQFQPDKYLDTPQPFINAYEQGVDGIVGIIIQGTKKILVYPNDWIMYGAKSKRFVICDEVFKEFFELVNEGN